jgi:hypothetical protein
MMTLLLTVGRWDNDETMFIPEWLKRRGPDGMGRIQKRFFSLNNNNPNLPGVNKQQRNTTVAALHASVLQMRQTYTSQPIAIRTTTTKQGEEKE